MAIQFSKRNSRSEENKLAGPFRNFPLLQNYHLFKNFKSSLLYT